jgi:hypothetical protein
MPTSSSRLGPPTTRPDPVARVIAVLQREVRPVAAASLRHTAGVSDGMLTLMDERGELEDCRPWPAPNSAPQA